MPRDEHYKILQCFISWLYLSPLGHSRTVSLFSLSVGASNWRSNVYIILPVFANEAKARSLIKRGNVFTLPFKSDNVPNRTYQ